MLAFIDKCRERDGDREAEEKRLTTGQHESAWLTDLALAKIPDTTKSHFGESKDHGVHRDDGMTVFNNKFSCDNMFNWSTKFQNQANRWAGGNCLQFPYII